MGVARVVLMPPHFLRYRVITSHSIQRYQLKYHVMMFKNAGLYLCLMYLKRFFSHKIYRALRCNFIAISADIAIMFGALVISIAALVIFFVYREFFREKDASKSLPPGPNRLPIVGNILDLPPAEIPEFQHWLKFKDLYGPISSVTVLGQTMIILHDKQAAYDIMAKMSLKTSSRPKSVFAYEMCGFDNYTSGRPYDATFRLHRKLMHQQAGTKQLAARFNEIQDVESCHLLQRILDDSENLIKHFRT